MTDDTPKAIMGSLFTSGGMNGAFTIPKAMVPLTDIIAVSSWYTNYGFFYPKVHTANAIFYLESFESYELACAQVGLLAPSRDGPGSDHYKQAWESFLTKKHNEP